ncbi:MAG: RsiV family protein, partial [Mycobacterium leprae]
GLFRPGSDYVARLKDLVKAQMAAQTSKTWSGKEPPIGEASHFMVQADGLQLYYNPYEIASYADGLPSFTIPYNQIADLIDADGAFWKAFH